MILKFKVTFHDLFKYNIAHQLRSPGYHILALVLPTFLLWYGTTAMDYLLSEMIPGFFAMYITAWVLEIIATYALLLFRNNNSTCTDFELEVTEDGIVEKSPSTSTHYNWIGILSIKPCFGLFAIDLGSGKAILIPSRIFSSAGERTHFRTTINDHISR